MMLRFHQVPQTVLDQLENINLVYTINAGQRYVINKIQY